MTSTPAFSSPAPATTFTSRRSALTASRPALRVSAPPARRGVSMQLPKIPNPFAKKEPEPSKEPEPGKEPEAAADAPAPAKAAKDLPVQSGGAAARLEQVKRGFDLLKEDILKSAPERAGVGRQDQEALTMKPMPGEPGYKPPSIATVKVSQLGISPFSDDKNYVGKVGGIEAVKKAATDVKAGKSASEIKKEVMQVVDRAAPDMDEFTSKPTPAPKAPEDNLPDYLRPIPEDTPRKGSTWKNYAGR